MRRSVRRGLALACAALALLALAGWQWQHEASESPGTLLTLEPASIQQVVLRIGSAPAQHFAKRQGQWWRTDGTAVRADDGRLNELTQTAAATVLRWRPAGDFDPARIGLSPSSASLSLDGHALDFGETSVTGPQCYVRVDGRIALISLAYTPRPLTGKPLEPQ